MKRLFSIWLMALVCVAASGMTDAERDSVSREFSIDEVTITARSRETAVMPVQTLSGAQLQGLSTQSVADALRYFSGVQVKDYGGVGGMKTVDVRSMGTHHLGVFYDGIEIGNAQNGTVDLGKFSLDNIEEIALYNGQKAEIFQSAKDYGSAGTLYIRARRPRFANGEKYHLVATMKAGTFGLANPSLLYEQKLTDRLSLSLSAEYMYATGRYHFRYHKLNPDLTVAWDTVGIRQNGDVQAARAEAGLYGYLPEGKWQVKGYFYDSEKGIPQAIVRNVWTCAQRQWDRNAFVQGQIEHSFFDRWDIRLSAKYSNDYMRYLNPDTTRMYIDNQFWQQEVYLSLVNRVKLFSWWDVAVSADYQWNALDATLANFAYPERHTGMLAFATAFHYRWIRLQASVLGTLVEDKKRGMETTVYATAGETPTSPAYWTPAVFLSAQPLLQEQWFIRAFYKDIFRLPTFNDLYYTDVGNIHLEPEYARQYDAGMEYTKSLNTQHSTLNLKLKADAYFNQIRNKIVAVPKGNSQYRWMMMNIGYVEIVGTDVNAGLTMLLPHEVEWGINLSYTYQQARDLTDPTDTLCYGGQISYIPWHSGSVIGHLAWKGWGLNYSFIYVGERYHNSANIPANYEQPWYTHDLALSKIWEIPSSKSRYTMQLPRPACGEGVRGRGDTHPILIHTTIEINNFLNQQYDIVHNYPMPGINGKLILKLEI
ncbi:MAG: TonB-dependent receptor [Paludibacteraceae bacterium]